SQSRRKITMPLKTLEYSPIPLNLTNHKWAISGVKLHSRIVFMENGLSYPDYSVIASAKEHNWGQLEVLIDDKVCMYIFNRRYLRYKRFDHMTNDNYHFVSCFRKKHFCIDSRYILRF